MSRKQNGFLLPENLDIGDDRYCVRIKIPTDEVHVRNFWGNLYSLAKWYNHERDADKSAVTVARMWLDLIECAHEEFKKVVSNCGANDCDAIAQCIADSDAVRNALGNWLKDDYPLLFSEKQIEPTSPFANGRNPSCSDAVLWGMCNEIIDRMEQNNIDALEYIASSNSLSLVSELMQLVPGGDATGVDDWLRASVELGQWTLSSYQSYSNQSLLESLKCELFCQSREDCYPSFDKMFQSIKTRLTYFGSFSEPIESIVSFFELIRGIESGDLTDQKVFEGMWYLQTMFMSINITTLFPRVNRKSFDLYASLGADNPSTDYALLCDCVPAVTWVADFGTIVSVVGNIVTVDSALDTMGKQVVYIKRSDNSWFGVNAYTSAESLNYFEWRSQQTNQLYQTNVFSPTGGDNYYWGTTAGTTTPFRIEIEIYGV